MERKYIRICKSVTTNLDYWIRLVTNGSIFYRPLVAWESFLICRWNERTYGSCTVAYFFISGVEVHHSLESWSTMCHRLEIDIEAFLMTRIVHVGYER